MRYLAIDLGDQRTGLALGDDLTRIAAPLRVLEIPRARDQGRALLDAILHAIDTDLGRDRAALVLGLPLNMDDSEGPRAKLVRDFAQRLAAATSLPIHLHDERLSTAEADWSLARSGLTRDAKKHRRDAIAAAAILRDFLNQLPPGSHTPLKT